MRRFKTLDEAVIYALGIHVVHGPCKPCQGTGHIKLLSSDLTTIDEATCGNCGGTGKVIVGYETTFKL